MALLISTSQRIAEEIKRERSWHDVAFMIRQMTGELNEAETRGLLLGVLLSVLGHSKQENNAVAKLLGKPNEELVAAVRSAALTLADQ